MIEVRINGESRRVAEGLTLLDLLRELDLLPGATVVEQNRAIVDRDAYATTRIAAGDALELVQIVAGG